MWNALQFADEPLNFLNQFLIKQRFFNVVFNFTWNFYYVNNNFYYVYGYSNKFETLTYEFVVVVEVSNGWAASA